MSTIEMIKGHAHRDEIEDAALLVYTTVDGMLTAGQGEDVRALLRAMAATPLPLTVLLSGLTITLPWIQEAGEAREALYRAAWKAAGDRAPEVLRGLGRNPS